MGDGPCLADGDCGVGSVCGLANGARHGLPAEVDVCAAPGCGDGWPGPDEPCDDGNLDDADGCTSACRLPCRDVAVLTLAGERVVIDRYEASRPDASADGPGQQDERACSRVGVVPWFGLDYAAAAAACAASGAHLCTQDEWLVACAGAALARPYPYGSFWEAGVCNGYRGATNVLAGTGEYDECLTPEGVYDLVGNVHEWIDTGEPDDFVAGGSYKLTALAVSQRLDSCWAQITVVPAEDVGFRCCGP